MSTQPRPRFSFAVLSCLAYLLAFTLLIGAWWLHYAPRPDIQFGSMETFFSVVFGLLMLTFGRKHAKSAGRTPAQMLVILPSAAIGVGIFVLAILRPAQMISQPVSSTLLVGALLIAIMAFQAAGHAARKMRSGAA